MKTNIILAVTVLLCFFYGWVLIDIGDSFLNSIGTKGSDKRTAYGIAMTFLFLFGITLLAGVTFDFLQKKYDRETWDKYHGSIE